MKSYKDSRTDSSVGRGRLSDAGGPRFESQAGWVTGKSIPILWRDKRPAVKGLWPSEHHAGKFHPDQKRLLRVKQQKLTNERTFKTTNNQITHMVKTINTNNKQEITTYIQIKS